jgi:dTDP-4-dehydrorhamnose 3,5-epimerase
MQKLETRLEGPILVRPTVHRDHRGFFHESYRRSAYSELGIADDFVQDNHSRSSRGVVRGMHFQVGAGMAKLVRCSKGAIVDVVVDLRRGSPTFGEWEAFELDDDNLHNLYCPIGFAHGICTTSESADVLYKCSSYYDEGSERGIAYDDPDVGIEWPDIPLVPSARDANAPRLRDVEAELPFVYEPPVIRTRSRLKGPSRSP